MRCARLSQDVYQDFSEVKFRDLSGLTPLLTENSDTDTQMAIFEDVANNTGYIIFRGSSANRDWSINFEVQQSGYEWSRADKKAYKAAVSETIKEAVKAERDLTYPDAYASTSNPVKMHKGFISAYLSVRQTVHDTVQQSSISQWVITGHSLGGALATLCGIDVQYNFSTKTTVEVYTYGAPKVGNDAFVESYNRRVPNTQRYVFGSDIVTKLPRWWQGNYGHVKQLVAIKRGFNWRFISGNFQDHRLTNYIDALAKREA